MSSSGFFAPFVAAQSGEKMVCKSGGDMVASVEFKHLGFRASTPGFGHSLTLEEYKDRLLKPTGDTTLIITFKRGSAGFKTRSPAPGECTWGHRGVKPSEPNKLKLLYGNFNFAVRVSCSKKRCLATGIGGQHMPSLVKLIDAVKFEGHLISFTAQLRRNDTYINPLNLHINDKPVRR